MIEITSLNEEQLHSTLETKGGFAWWYADLVDAECNGFVLIWSWGLPFLPGSRSLPTPRQRPSLNLAAYRRGRSDFYLLQELPENQASLLDASGSGSMGSSRFQVTSDASHVRLTAEIEAPVPRSLERVTGRLELTGSRLVLPTTGSTFHQWSPFTTTGQGSVQLRHGDHVFELEGSGYFDSNFGSVPLHQQGIESWRWGRLSFQHETLVFYDIRLEGSRRTLHLFRQTSARQEKLEMIPEGSLDGDELKWGKYGVSFPRHMVAHTKDGDYSIRASHIVDDGPFYQRLLLRGENPKGEVGQGIGEVVIPDRIDLPWQRPFVRMRTHRVGACNSPFLPLFCGARGDRVGRLLRHLASLGATP